MMAVFFFIAHVPEKGCKFYAQPQTGAEKKCQKSFSFSKVLRPGKNAVDYFFGSKQKRYRGFLQRLYINMESSAQINWLFLLEYFCSIIFRSQKMYSLFGDNVWVRGQIQSISVEYSIYIYAVHDPVINYFWD